MPTNSPIYSAFGLISIESIWPSVRGDEVPISYLDIKTLIDGGRLRLDEDQDAGARTDLEELNRQRDELLDKLAEDAAPNRYFEFSDLKTEKENTSNDPGNLNPIDIYKATALDLFNRGPEQPLGDYEFEIVSSSTVIDKVGSIPADFSPSGNQPGSSQIKPHLIPPVPTGVNFDTRYFELSRVSSDTRVVLNEFFSEVGVNASVVRVTSLTGSYPDISDPHFGFDVVLENSAGGKDVAAVYPFDTPGQVVFSGATPTPNRVNLGQYVRIFVPGQQGSAGIYIMFAHLQEEGRAQTNDILRKGDVIGIQGGTGGFLPHLHIELREANSAPPAVNPTGLDAGFSFGSPIQDPDTYGTVLRPFVNLSTPTSESFLIKKPDGSFGPVDFDVQQDLQRYYVVLNLLALARGESLDLPGENEPVTYEIIDFLASNVSILGLSGMTLYNKLISLRDNALQMRNRLNNEYSEANLAATYGNNNVFYSIINTNEIIPTSLNRPVYISLIESNISILDSLLVRYEQDINNLTSQINSISNTLVYGSSLYPRSFIRPDFSNVLSPTEGFKNRKGYFRIIPLNVLQVNTTSNVGGTVGQSSFDVVFTMDDLLLIADQYGTTSLFESISPNFIPISTEAAFNELSDILGGNIPQKALEDLVPDGFNVYRISGQNYTLNLEDLLEANDTVTIWLYHDPKEFDFVVPELPVDTPVNAPPGDGENSENPENENGSPETPDQIGGPSFSFTVKSADGVASAIYTILYTTVEENNSIKVDGFTDIILRFTPTSIQYGAPFDLSSVDFLLELDDTGNLIYDSEVFRAVIQTEVDEAVSLTNVLNIIQNDNNATSLYITNLMLSDPIGFRNYPKVMVDYYALLKELMRNYLSSPDRDNFDTSVYDDRFAAIISEYENIKNSSNIKIFDYFKPLMEEQLNNGITTNDPSTGDQPAPNLPLTSPGTPLLIPGIIRDFNFFDSFIANQDFSYVIGSGSRRSQDDFNLVSQEGGVQVLYSPTLTERALIDAGFLNQYIDLDNLKKIAEGDIDIDLSDREIANLIKVLGETFGIYGLLPAERIEKDFEDSIEDNRRLISNMVSSILGDEFSSLSKQTLNRILSVIFLTDIELGALSPEQSVPLQRVYREYFNKFFDKLPELISEYKKLPPSAPYDDVDYISIWNRVMGPEYSGVLTDDEISAIVSGFSGFLQNISNRLIENAIRFIVSQHYVEVKESEIQSPGFFNKRKMLVSRSHGETPYLVFKGHIKNFEVKYGASTGVHTIKISGSGYEKILMDNILYIEDRYTSGLQGIIKALTVNTIYNNTLPTLALMDFIESNVPRYILIGKQTKLADQVTKELLDEVSSGGRRGFSAAELSSISEIIEQESAPTEPLSKGLLSRYLPENQTFVRGKFILNLYSDPRSTEINNPQVRFYYPINYLNINRLRETVRVFNNSIPDYVLQIAVSLNYNQNIANNILQFNGPKEYNQIFVDETGRLRQHISFETMERTPSPIHTPTIMDKDVIASGASFSRNSEQIINIMDVIPNTFVGNNAPTPGMLIQGRTLPRGNDYIPIIGSNYSNQFFNYGDVLYQNFYESVSESLFRYGLRRRVINDSYSGSGPFAHRRSIMLHEFFSRPIKNARIKVKGNSSYRIGDTVLVYLNSYKYKSKEVVDVQKTIDWLNYILTDDDLLNLYIGVDERWYNHNAFYKTITLDENKNYSYFLRNNFKSSNPSLSNNVAKRFVAERFIKTFEYLLSKGFNLITAEYFPNTYWASEFLSSVPNDPSSSSLKRAYDSIYKKIKKEPLAPSDVISPEVMNRVRMQNFRATSYYIEGVNHSYVHGSEISTSLSLNYGQDNLVIVEPYTMLPIGFMSMEKRIRIGYDDKVINSEGGLEYPQNPDYNTHDRILWQDFENKVLSEAQKLYINQNKEEIEFKKKSFLYSSQAARNASNFMYELATEIGLDR